MFVLHPTSAMHAGYPACQAYNYERAAEAAVHRAAYDYAVAQARAEALREQRAEQERRYREAALREQAHRRAQAAEFLEALYEREHALYYGETYSLIDAERYRRAAELDAARRRAELIQQRQQAERARAAAIARKRAEAERIREAQRREQEHWIALLTRQFGGAEIAEKPTASGYSQPVLTNVQPEPTSVKSELKRRLESEADDEVRETLEHLLSELVGAVPAAKKAKVDKGKARETPAIPFSFAKSQPEAPAKPATPQSFTVPVNTPSPAPAAATEGADLHRTPAMTPAQAQEAKDRRDAAQGRTLSLGTIARIEESLRALESSFVFPADLDLAPTPSRASGWDSDSETELAYTPRNKPVHAYEHALNGLLAQLDAVESFGDDAVRGRRKEVVNSVERALRAVGRRVEESRERARTPVAEEQSVSIPIQDAAEKVEVDAAAEVTDNATPAPVEALADTTPVVAESTEAPSTEVTPASTEPVAAVEVESPEVVMQDAESTPTDHVASDSAPLVETTEPAPTVDAATSEDATPSVETSTPEPVSEEAAVEPAATEAAEVPAPASEASVDTVSDATVPSVEADTPSLEEAVAHEETVASEHPAEDAQPTPSSDSSLPEATPVDSAAPAEQTAESSSPAPSSPTPSDDTFLLASNPIPDPAPHKPVDEPVVVEKPEEDLDIIDADEAAEVLGELNEAEWSDVEAH